MPFRARPLDDGHGIRPQRGRRRFPVIKRTAILILIVAFCVAAYLLFPKGTGNGESAGTLHVYGNETAGDFTNPVFRQRHPGIPWEGNDTTGFASAIDMAQHMMTQDRSFDLYAISYGSGGFRLLRDKHYCMGIADDAIRAQISRMHPFIRDAVISDGQIHGVPISVSITGLGYHVKNCEAVGITEDKLPRDYMAWFDLIDWWLAKGHEEHPEYKLFEDIEDGRTFLIGTIVSAYIDYCQYTNMPLRFDTPVFRRLADRVDALDAELLNAQIKRADHEMEYRPVSLFRVNQAYHDLQGARDLPDEKPLLLSLVPGEQPRIAADLRLFIVNPASARADTAIRYMACFLEGLPQERQMLLFGGDHEPVVNHSFAQEQGELEQIHGEIQASLETCSPDERLELTERLRLVEEQLANADQNKWVISPDTIAAYQQLAGSLFVRDQNILERNASDGTLEIQSLVRRYVHRELTLDMFIRAADERILFIKAEDGGA